MKARCIHGYIWYRDCAYGCLQPPELFDETIAVSQKVILSLDIEYGKGVQSVTADFSRHAEIRPSFKIG